MFLKSKFIQISFIFTSAFLQFAYAGETTRIVFYTKPVTDNWPDSYYVVYGFAAAAIVLFVMSVMKKHDEIQ